MKIQKLGVVLLGLILIILLYLGMVGRGTEDQIQAQAEVSPQKLLGEAVLAQDLGRLDELCQQGVDLNQEISQASQKFTPLRWAVEFRNLEMVKLLLHYEVKLDVQDQYEMTPLYWALIDDQLEMSMELIRAGAENPYAPEVEEFMSIEEVDLPEDQLTEEFLVELASRGASHFWRMLHETNEDGFTELNGEKVMYLSSDIDTKEKYLAYLGEVYTERISLEIFERFDYQEDQGRLYHYGSGEMGWSTNWKASKVKLVKTSKDGSRRQYRYLVPAGEAGIGLYDIYLERTGDGWRLDTCIDMF